jgi:predicted acetyltransferase
MHVALVEAAAGDKPVLRRMMELYQYDFSEIEDTDLDEHGCFGYRYLDHYWAEPGRWPFLVRADGRLAGFALARALPEAAELLQVAEFFVMRRYRRHGVGRAAAELLFGWRPALWTVPVVARNHAALAFWERVLARYPTDRVTTRPGGSDWDGPILTLDTRP